MGKSEAPVALSRASLYRHVVIALSLAQAERLMAVQEKAEALGHVSGPVSGSHQDWKKLAGRVKRITDPPPESVLKRRESSSQPGKQ